MKKDLYWQSFRGICILSVVLIHCNGYSTDLNFFDVNSVYYLFFRNIVNFPVACLFFLSGYFVKNDVTISWIRKRLTRLVIPYLVFSSGYIGIQLALFLKNTDFIGLKEYVYSIPRILLLGEAATPLYFTIVLIYFTLLLPILTRIAKSKLWVMPYLLTILMQITMYVIKIKYESSIKYFILTPIWIGFYYLGICFKIRKMEIKIQKKTAIGMLVCTLGWQIGESIILFLLGAGEFAFSQLRFSGFGYALSIIIVAILFYRKVNSNFLSYVGDNSYSIYMIHCFYMQFMWIIYSKYHLETYPLVLIQIAETLISILLSLVSIIVIKRIFKKKSQLFFGI